MMHSGPHKLMLFGAACTHVTDPIAKASKHWHLTQVRKSVFNLFNVLFKQNQIIFCRNITHYV